MKRSTLLLLLMVPGCFNPDDILPVHGAVGSPDGVESQAVRLLRDPMALKTANTCADAKPFKETTTDEAGNFTFEVFRAQATRLSGMGTFCFRVETSFPSGTSAFSDILGLFSEVTLPAFPDWRAQPTRSDGVLHFEPAALIPDQGFEGDQLVHRSEWITADGGVAWAADDRVLALDPVNISVSPARQPMAMEDPALEDFAGSVRFNARLTKPGEDSGPFGTSASTIEVRSGQTLPLAGARTPLSRGMACAGFGNPCPLTDGDLTPIDAGMQVFSFTFPTPARVSAVVVRGVETESSLMFVLLEQPDGGPRRVVQYALPTSLWNAGVPSFVLKPQPDGGFQFSPKSDPRFFVVAFDAGAPVSAVTVGFVDDVDRISEISLFE